MKTRRNHGFILCAALPESDASPCAICWRAHAEAGAFDDDFEQELLPAGLVVRAWTAQPTQT